MSIRSLTDLAVRRDQTPRGDIVASNDTTRTRERAWDVLVTAFPSEILVLYTALTGGLLPVLIEQDRTAYLPLRWGLLIAAVVLTPLVVHTVRGGWPDAKRTPVAEMAAATLAATACLLTMPGSPLIAVLSDDAGALACGIIVFGTGTILPLVFGKQLRTGTAKTASTRGNPGDTAEDSARQPV